MGVLWETKDRLGRAVVMTNDAWAHIAWRAATEPDPPPEVATRLVADVKELFERYGIEPEPDDRA